LWLTSSGFLSPSTLALATAVDGCTSRRPLKSLPHMFDASPYAVTQHFATSKDGTAVPYFQIGKKELPLDGTNPTLLDG
jgi:prolyl oligopeptidase